MPPAALTVWAGIDVGKTHHWVEVVDATGATLLSRRVLNDQVEIDELIAAVVPLADSVQWAMDIVGAPSALLLALLARAQQQARYASGRVVSVMSSAVHRRGQDRREGRSRDRRDRPAATRPDRHRSDD